MDNKCMSDKQFQNAKVLLILLLKLIDKESKGYYRFQKANSTGLFDTTLKAYKYFLFRLL